MKIKLFGARGGIPTPSTKSFKTEKYGGNTTCLEVIAGGNEYIFDAGTGIKNLGDELMMRDFDKGGKEIILFLSHLHLDHIHGFPFFKPAYINGNRIHIYGGRKWNREMDLCNSIIDRPIAERIFRDQQKERLFPINLEEMCSEILFYDLPPFSYKKGNIKVEYLEANHPGGGFSYKITEDKKAFVYIGDCELNFLEDAIVTQKRKEIVEFIRDAEVAYFDAQYSPEEYDPKKYGIDKPSKKGYGHS